MRDECMKVKSSLVGSKIYINADEDRETRKIKYVLRQIAKHCRSSIEIANTLYDGKQPYRIPARFRPSPPPMNDAVLFTTEQSINSLVLSRRPPRYMPPPFAAVLPVTVTLVMVRSP